MNDFRTSVSCASTNQFIGLKTPILTIGSCFADAIGSRLKTNKILTQPNPFGTIYNPHSIHKVLQYAIQNAVVPESTYVETSEVFLNYDFHSELNSHNKEELKAILLRNISNTHHFLKSAQCLIITYGTAWIYQRNDNGEIVANCHKMPGNLFSKSLLTHKKIIESFEALYKDLKSFNPSIQIILTVSPVRHLKDTLELNSVSKAVLRLACHALSSTYNDVHYFPAYEIMLDDLRDYRFYKADMIHPSEVAEDYIWQKFTACYADANFKKFIEDWKPIIATLSHRPFHHTTDAHQRFLKKTLDKLEAFKDQVDVDEEIQMIKSQQTSQ
jgi:hypothetical protein